MIVFVGLVGGVISRLQVYFYPHRAFEANSTSPIYILYTLALYFIIEKLYLTKLIASIVRFFSKSSFGIYGNSSASNPEEEILMIRQRIG